MMSLGKEFSLQPAQQTRTGMTFMPLTTPEGGPIGFLLGGPHSFPARVPFEPSVFGGGVGHEQRKSIRFELDDDVLESGTSRAKSRSSYRGRAVGTRASLIRLPSSAGH